MTVSLQPHATSRSLASILTGALRDAVIALVLFGLMVGLRSEEGSDNQLILRTRFVEVAILVGIIFVTSIVIALLRQWWQRHKATTSEPGRLNRSAGPLLSQATRLLAPALLVFAVLFPVLFHNSGYALGLGILVLTYVMLGWGLNIVVGLAGLLVLGYAGFYAIGAYSFALLATPTSLVSPEWFPIHFVITFGWPVWICLPLAGLIAALFGVLLGFPVLRLRGDYLAIVTLAFGEIVRLVIINWGDLTGGTNGIRSIPRPTLFGVPLDASDNGLAALLGFEFSPTHRYIYLYYIILLLALITNWVVIRLRRLPIGRAWEALREDEVACRALGINITTTKLTAFAISALFGGLTGAFFASSQGFISPESFTFMESAQMLAIVVLGGMGSQLGTVLAAMPVMLIQEVFRDLGSYRMLMFGLAMVLMMNFRPHGLIGQRTPTVVLQKSGPNASSTEVQG